MMNDTKKVPRRILGSLIASLSAGVVPRTGAPYIAIGRDEEIMALLNDLEHISDGEGRVRFIIGRYGSGKSFLMQLMRGYALDKNFITADTDLSPERRLYGSGGNGLATYKELLRNLASKSSPDGGALSKILSRWIVELRMKAEQSNGNENENEKEKENEDEVSIVKQIEREVLSVVRDVEFAVGGFDFARVLSEYYKAYILEDEEKQSSCLRWFRGEYGSKTEARQALGFRVSCVIDDENWYDFLKIWAILVRKIGYRGLVVFIDECVNLYKIPNRVSRENNYEKILSMFNDTLQGHSEGLEIIFGGTPQFLDDTRRGVFSYEALRSRLCDSKFELEGVRNMNHPIFRLVRLSDNELFALLKRLTDLFGQYYEWSPRVKESDLEHFLRISSSRAGSDSMLTPRELIRDYITVLNLLMQNESVSFDTIIEKNTAVKGQHATMKSDGTNEQLEDEKKKITLEDILF